VVSICPSINREEEKLMEGYGKMAISDAHEARDRWGLKGAGGGVLVEPVTNKVGGCLQYYCCCC